MGPLRGKAGFGPPDHLVIGSRAQNSEKKPEKENDPAPCHSNVLFKNPIATVFWYEKEKRAPGPAAQSAGTGTSECHATGDWAVCPRAAVFGVRAGPEQLSRTLSEMPVMGPVPDCGVRQSGRAQRAAPSQGFRPGTGWCRRRSGALGSVSRGCPAEHLQGQSFTTHVHPSCYSCKSRISLFRLET